LIKDDEPTNENVLHKAIKKSEEDTERFPLTLKRIPDATNELMI
jgi:hypothetical protein